MFTAFLLVFLLNFYSVFVLVLSSTHYSACSQAILLFRCKTPARLHVSARCHHLVLALSSGPIANVQRRLQLMDLLPDLHFLRRRLFKCFEPLATSRLHECSVRRTIVVCAAITDYCRRNSCDTSPASLVRDAVFWTLQKVKKLSQDHLP